jgi:hypothetical protein
VHNELSTTPWRRMGEWTYRSIFLDLGTSWRWVVNFTPRLLYHSGKRPGTHYIGGWVNPRAGMDDLEKRKFLTLPGFELRSLRHPASRYTDYATPAPHNSIILKEIWKTCTWTMVTTCLSRWSIYYGIESRYRTHWLAFSCWNPPIRYPKCQFRTL